MTDAPYKSDPLFCELVALVVNVEGGYVNDPKDPGGPTKYGISLNYNRPELAAIGIHDADGVQGLRREQALQIYYSKYWLASRANTIKDKRLAYIHFDAAVNHGVGEARLLLARSNARPTWTNVERFLEYLRQRQQLYTGDKNFARYGEGWINRLSRLIAWAIAFPLTREG